MTVDGASRDEVAAGLVSSEQPGGARS